jgi:hypothetical protein
VRDYRGFLRRVQILYALYGMLPTTWQLSILGALSAVGTILGYYQGDFFRAYVGLMIGFGLGSMEMVFGQQLVRNATVYSKLGIRGMGISNVSADIKGNFVREFNGITVNFLIQNTGIRDNLLQASSNGYINLKFGQPRRKTLQRNSFGPGRISAVVQFALNPAYQSARCPLGRSHARCRQNETGNRIWSEGWLLVI